MQNIVLIKHYHMHYLYLIQTLRSRVDGSLKYHKICIFYGVLKKFISPIQCYQKHLKNVQNNWFYITEKIRSSKTLKIVLYVKKYANFMLFNKKLKFWPWKHCFQTEITCGNDSSHKIYPWRVVFLQNKVSQNIENTMKIIIWWPNYIMYLIYF